MNTEQLTYFNRYYKPIYHNAYSVVVIALEICTGMHREGVSRTELSYIYPEIIEKITSLEKEYKLMHMLMGD